VIPFESWIAFWLSFPNDTRSVEDGAPRETAIKHRKAEAELAVARAKSLPPIKPLLPHHSNNCVIEKSDAPSLWPAFGTASRLLDQIELQFEELESSGPPKTRSPPRFLVPKTTGGGFTRSRQPCTQAVSRKALPREVACCAPARLLAFACGGSRFWPQEGRRFRYGWKSVPRPMEVISMSARSSLPGLVRRSSQAPARSTFIASRLGPALSSGDDPVRRSSAASALKKPPSLRYAKDGMPISPVDLADQSWACCAFSNRSLSVWEAHVLFRGPNAGLLPGSQQRWRRHHGPFSLSVPEGKTPRRSGFMMADDRPSALPIRCGDVLIIRASSRRASRVASLQLPLRRGIFQADALVIQQTVTAQSQTGPYPGVLPAGSMPGRIFRPGRCGRERPPQSARQNYSGGRFSPLASGGVVRAHPTRGFEIERRSMPSAKQRGAGLLGEKRAIRVAIGTLFYAISSGRLFAQRCRQSRWTYAQALAVLHAASSSTRPHLACSNNSRRTALARNVPSARRKSWLFAGSESRGRRAATMYSIHRPRPRMNVWIRNP